MKVGRVWGGFAALAVLLALVMASSASALELPQTGRCVKAATPATGLYTAATCIKVSTGTQLGKYEWVPASFTEKLTFKTTFGEATLTTVGHPAIKCIGGSMTGEWTGAKTANVEVEFQACLSSTANEQCQNPPPNGTKSLIEGKNLQATLGFTRHEEVNGKLVVAVGMDLKPPMLMTSLFTYECGNPLETAEIEGSVIARLKPINKMTTEFNPTILARSTGEQIPQSFAGGEKDTLSTTYKNGLETVGTAPTALNIKSQLGQNAVPMEIKAIEK
jgi:hypothetical protein